MTAEEMFLSVSSYLTALDFICYDISGAFSSKTVQRKLYTFQLYWRETFRNRR
jgi:hypothetical protein